MADVPRLVKTSCAAGEKTVIQRRYSYLVEERGEWLPPLLAIIGNWLNIS